MRLITAICALAAALVAPAALAQNFGTFAVPSSADEKATYKSWGWSWNANQEPEATTEPIANYVVNDPDIHGDTEGDDLWAYLMQYQRSGNPIFLSRARAWRRYWVDDALKCAGDRYRSYCYDRDAFQADHMYGPGLLAWYVYSCSTGTCDNAALATAEAMGGDVETYMRTRVNGAWPTPGQFAMAYYEIRGHARHLLLATRLAEVTGKARWIELRDRYIALWLASPDWDARGMYFLSDYATDRVVGAGAHAAGARIVSTFEVGILADALAQAYRVTGNAALRERVVALASFVDQYGLDPAYQYSASWFGIVGGKLWHSYNPSGATTVNPNAFWNPVYTTSLVNLLVYAYKYTGTTRYLDRAKHFFDRGTKGIYGSPTARQAGPNQVGHFVDTVFATSHGNFYFDYNKGELQYTYMLFENGGRPTVLAGATPAPTVNFSTSVATLNPGQSATLNWSSSNASGCNASGGWQGTRATAGNQVVSPSATTSYTLACSGAGGTTTRALTITVAAAPDPAPTLALAASVGTISAGQAVTLTWSTTNATACSASGGWSGSRATSGNASVTPSASATYTLACNGPGGNVTRSVSVTVTAAGGSSELQDGVAVVGISTARGASVAFHINVPAGARNLRFRTNGGSGNADLYVRYGALPTTTSSDYRATGAGNNATITIAAPRAGTYYAIVYGRRAASAVTLTASFD